MQILTFKIRTGMGNLTLDSEKILLNHLTKDELAEVDSIGYRRKKLDGTKISIEDYLNSLNKGIWKVVLEGHDGSEFTDVYSYILVK